MMSYLKQIMFFMILIWIGASPFIFFSIYLNYGVGIMNNMIMGYVLTTIIMGFIIALNWEEMD